MTTDEEKSRRANENEGSENNRKATEDERIMHTPTWECERVGL